jgi:NAD(P)-dependent dehydrogenase (short-subunit alcohol dehydrogenase family)
MKTAVITGGGRGLGRLTAERMADRGFRVLVTDVDLPSAQQTARRVGRGAWALEQDVAEPESHARVAAAAASEGPLKLWINNAGILRAATAWAQSDDDVRRQIEVNLLGVIWGSRAAIAEMQKTGGGQIINVGSMASIVPAPGLSVYVASKHAVLGFSTALQGDLDAARIPIKVSCFCPDAIDTDMVRGVADRRDAALLFSSGRLLRPEKTADLIAGLVDHPRLLLFHPRSREAMARALAPFPEVALKILAQFRRLGEHHRRQRTS